MNISEDDFNNAPPTPKPPNYTETNNIYYNCSECSSLIEILSINEKNNIIKFKCLNSNCNHEKEKIMTIKDYIEAMIKFNNKKINQDICEIHKNNKYISYCLDCKCHLCQECLKSRTHLFHNKNLIIEIQPIRKELDIILLIIEDYKKRIEKLNKEKIQKIKELDHILENDILKENLKKEDKIKENKLNKNKELDLNEKQYLFDINEIRKKYEQEIKLRKNKYEKKINKIKNNYELIKQKDNIIHKFKIEELNKIHNDEIQKLKYDFLIANMSDFKRLNEILYNTYDSFNNNYYNNLNINTLLLSYINNDYLNNKIKNEILKNEYDDILKIILQKNNSEDEIKKIRNDLKIKEEYETKIKKYEEKEKEYITKLEKLEEEFHKKKDCYKIINKDLFSIKPNLVLNKQIITIPEKSDIIKNSKDIDNIATTNNIIDNEEYFKFDKEMYETEVLITKCNNISIDNIKIENIGNKAFKTLYFVKDENNSSKEIIFNQSNNPKLHKLAIEGDFKSGDSKCCSIGLALNNPNSNQKYTLCLNIKEKEDDKNLSKSLRIVINIKEDNQDKEEVMKQLEIEEKRKKEEEEEKRKKEEEEKNNFWKKKKKKKNKK